MEIFYANGASEVFFVESYSTIEDIKKEVVLKYDLEEARAGHYGILECCKKNNISEETFVDDYVKVMDVVSSWYNEIEFLTKMMKEATLKIKYRLYFKIRFDFPSELLSHRILKYYECSWRFKKNRYRLDYPTYRKLLALKLRVDFGSPTDDRNIHIHCNFKHLTPKLDRDTIVPERYNQIIEEIYSDYSENKLDTINCMMEFLKECERLDLCVSELFPVKLKI